MRRRAPTVTKIRQASPGEPCRIIKAKPTAKVIVPVTARGQYGVVKTPADYVAKFDEINGLIPTPIQWGPK